MSKPRIADELMRDCVNGNALAWQEFVSQFSYLVFWTVKNKSDRLKHALCEADIYDISQQLFLSIWQKKKLKSIKNPENISAWLIKVAKNTTSDYIKSRCRRKEIEETHEQENLKNPPTPQDENSKDDLQKKITSFIDTLPLKQRRIGTLYFFYQLQYSQISKIVNSPIGTTSNAIARLKKDLKRYILKKGYRI